MCISADDSVERNVKHREVGGPRESLMGEGKSSAHMGSGASWGNTILPIAPGSDGCQRTALLGALLHKGCEVIFLLVEYGVGSSGRGRPAWSRRPGLSQK